MADNAGVLVTTDELPFDRFEEVASAFGGVLDGER